MIMEMPEDTLAPLVLALGPGAAVRRPAAQILARGGGIAAWSCSPLLRLSGSGRAEQLLEREAAHG